MSRKEAAEEQRARVAASFNRHGGNISAVARELQIGRSTVSHHLKKIGVKKPVAGGTMVGVQQQTMPLPAKGKVCRYILTSAQNNTKVNQVAWDNLLALAKHYDAKVFVGTFSYNQNAYGPLSVKQGEKKEYQHELWFDEAIKPYITDKRIELGCGLVWCGEMNIQPTAVEPLSGLETYSGRKSAIFPHAKHALASIPAFAGEGVKFNYTTGTVTQKNYIAKKAGFTAEHHHIYGGLIAEVDSNGHWFVRQLESDTDGVLYDLDVRVKKGVVTEHHRAESITWGDLHATCLDELVSAISLGRDGPLEFLRPRFQFIHDLMEGVSVNHHAAKDPHEQFLKHKRGFDGVAQELHATSFVLSEYNRPWCQTVVVDSNHDNWLMRWLKEHDYRRDAKNAILFLEMQLAVYQSIEEGDEEFNLTEWCMRQFHCPGEIEFLRGDQSKKTCNDRIENGMHGHLGPNGARGTPANLNKVGRRANTGHTHSASIVNGLYTVGTSTNLNMGYNKGPSSWSHSHIITYKNSKRAIITMFAGKWRADGVSREE